MEISLSDADIRRFGLNVLDYNGLEGMNEAGLLRKLPLVLLYLNKIDSGHWVLIHRTPEGIEFFDSYSYKPDTEFAFIPEEMQKPKKLAMLLCEIIKHTPISYNQYQFQEKKAGVNTCGRHCIMRQMFSGVGIDDYKNGVDKVCRDRGINADELSVFITS